MGGVLATSVDEWKQGDGLTGATTVRELSDDLIKNGSDKICDRPGRCTKAARVPFLGPMEPLIPCPFLLSDLPQWKRYVEALQTKRKFLFPLVIVLSLGPPPHEDEADRLFGNSRAC
jgi:hypothetical protein